MSLDRCSSYELEEELESDGRQVSQSEEETWNHSSE